ncbi:MAG: S8 family serine peptidase, partial [Pseudomonadota bacterium]
VDVINMSLGARFGLPTDPSAVASSHAVRAGVIVVASAGNNGGLAYVTGSPGVSPEVITVAASISGGRRQIALATELEDAPLMPAQEGAGPVRLGPETLIYGVAVAASTDADVAVGNACEPLTNADELTGKAVIVSRGTCLFPQKYQMVQEAGGTAIILMNSSDDVSNLFVMGGIFPDEIVIPGLMITSTDGQRLLDALSNNDLPHVQFSSGFTVPTPTDLDDVIASFSSQGPGADGAGFKPDLAAPGRFTVSTQAGSGIEGVQRRGTSMAAPHVAGMAALLKQQYPDLPPASIKAMLQNSTVPSRQNGPGTELAEPLSRQGVGVMRGADASRLTSRIEPAGLSFGYINPRVSKSMKRTVQLYNMTDVERTYTGAQEIASSVSGVTVECPETVTVGASGTTDVDIRISVNANLIPTDNGQLSRLEASGWCIFDDGTDTLRIGYVAGADGASHAVLTQSPAKALMNSVRGTQAARSDGQLVNQGPQKAIAHSFVLINHDSPSRPGNIAAFGWRNTTLFTQPVLEFAVALKNSWDNPSNYRYFIRVDTDGDSSIESTLFAVDWSWLGFDPGTIITGIDFIENIEDVGSDNSVSHWMAENVDYNDRTILLPYFNAASGVNALFKPHERVLNVTLMVVDRYDNVSTLGGVIDLDNPAADQQGTHVIGAGSGVDVNGGNEGQLWIVPTNTEQHQSLVVSATQAKSAAVTQKSRPSKAKPSPESMRPAAKR